MRIFIVSKPRMLRLVKLYLGSNPYDGLASNIKNGVKSLVVYPRSLTSIESKDSTSLADSVYEAAGAYSSSVRMDKNLIAFTFSDTLFQLTVPSNICLPGKFANVLVPFKNRTVSNENKSFTL